MGGYDDMIIDACWAFSENTQRSCVVQRSIIANAHRRYVKWFDYISYSKLLRKYWDLYPRRVLSPRANLLNFWETILLSIDKSPQNIIEPELITSTRRVQEKNGCCVSGFQYLGIVNQGAVVRHYSIEH